MKRRMDREKAVNPEVEKALLRISLHKIRERLEREDYSQGQKDLIFEAIYPLINCCFRLLDYIAQQEAD